MSEHIPSSETAGSLAASLAQNTEGLIGRRGAEQAAILFEGQIGAATRAMSGKTKVIRVGDKAPQFTLPTQDGGKWNMNDFLEKREHDSLVIVFYRGSWCSYCNIYLRGLLQVQSELSDAKAALIAISTEAAPSSAEGLSTREAGFPTLVDEGGGVAEQFGLTFEMDETAKDILKNSNFDLAQRNADGRWVLPVPGTFVVDRKSNVLYAHIDPDYRKRPEPQEIVSVCRSVRR